MRASHTCISAPERTSPGLNRKPVKAHRVGKWGETLVSRILEANGYRVLQRNWRPPAGTDIPLRGELDIIAITPEDELAFIEVKTRSSEEYGHPFEAINRDKAKRTRELGILWCRLQDSLDFGHFRVDAVAVTGSPDKFTFEHLMGVA